MQADIRQQGVADGKIGNKTRVVFAESDQDLVLPCHPLDRQSPLAPIAPGFVTQRRQPAPWLDLADAFEILGQHALLGLDLLPGSKVLQGAAAATSEMRAARFHPMR